MQAKNSTAQTVGLCASLLLLTLLLPAVLLLPEQPGCPYMCSPPAGCSGHSELRTWDNLVLITLLQAYTQ
jgi:hypothetical protein